MKDAYGGILNLAFIVVFLVIIIGILGLIVSYTKAFKMKNAIISTIESYEAAGCDKTGSACYESIKNQAKKIAYSPSTSSCPNADGCVYKLVGKGEGSTGKGFFCICKFKAIDDDTAVYNVITQVDIDLPVINNIMGLKVFQVSGVTRPIYEP